MGFRLRSRKSLSISIYLILICLRLGFIECDFNGMISITISIRWVLQLIECVLGNCNFELHDFNCMISIATLMSWVLQLMECVGEFAIAVCITIDETHCMILSKIFNMPGEGMCDRNQVRLVIKFKIREGKLTIPNE